MPEKKNNSFPTFKEFKEILTSIEFSGEHGLYRLSQEECLFGANNDYQAIQLWLKNKVANKPNTLRVYQTQTERLLLWAILHKQKPISSLTHEDFKDYLSFLDNPAPASQWCIDKQLLKEKQRRGEKVHAKRWQKDWRPFKGPLSASAKNTAIHAISTMLNYWREFGYLKANMLKMIDISQYHAEAEKTQLTVIERVIDKSEWTALMRAVAEMPVGSRELRLKKHRLHYLLITLLITACRRQEIVDMQWADFKHERGVWRLYVFGKGSKYSKITLPDKYIDLANQYRSSLGLPPLSPRNNENQPVFTKLTRLQAVNGDTINRLVKAACHMAIPLVSSTESKQRLQQASAHWLRHTAATVLDDEGIDKTLIKMHLRHDSDKTTELYIHKNVDALKATLETLTTRALTAEEEN